MNKKFYSSNFFIMKTLVIRDIQTKYKGSILGIFWVFLIPISMLLVFSFIFGEVFQAKWPVSSNNNSTNFSINLFIGLSLFWFFSDFISRAPTLFSSNPNYIKKVIFPLEILPLVVLTSALFHFFIFIIIIFFTFIFSGIELHLSMLYFFIVIAITLPMLLGIGFFLSSIGVFIKDVNAIVGVLLNMLMFLSPVFYPLDNIPKHLQLLFQLNPLTLPIEQARSILLGSGNINLLHLSVYFVVSLSIFLIGYKTFKLTKKGFADVL